MSSIQIDQEATHKASLCHKTWLLIKVMIMIIIDNQATLLIMIKIKIVILCRLATLETVK